MRKFHLLVVCPLLLLFLISCISGKNLTVSKKVTEGKLVWIGGREAAKVWWVDDKNVLHWVNSENTLKKYWSWDQVSEVYKSMYKDSPVGANITEAIHPSEAKKSKWSMEPVNPEKGRLVWIGGRSTAKVWWKDSKNVLHWVPSEEVLKKYWSWDQVTEVSISTFNTLPIGPNIE